ncbi:MAG: YdbH domain-containing protein [Alphaproteobacteria bacterium]|nr:YdbH domain-containing protein [Alphaproteobacteria bacterium]
MATVFRGHRIGLALLALAAMLALAFFYPWKGWLENRLKAALEEQGFQNVQLTLSGASLTGLSLKDVTAGKAPPLTLKNVTLNYSLPELLTGHVRDLSLSELELEVRQSGKAWTMGGARFGQADAQAKTSFSIPVTPDELAAVPAGNAKLDNGSLRVITDMWKLDVPLNLTWQKEPEPKLSAKSEGMKFKTQGFDVTAGDASADAALVPDEKQWKGRWQLKDVKITGGNTEIPALDGNGSLTAQADRIAIHGQFESADHSTKIVFQTDYFLGAPEKSKLTVAEAEMPWNGGTLSAQQAVMPFGEKQDIGLKLKVRRVAANALLQQLTGGRATATGTLSGDVPVTLKADGTILLHQGTLEADGPGVISMPPDVIPGDNEQVAFVRSVLKNLHYSLLSIQADSGKDGQLTVLMTLQGQNPDVPVGRPVKVNVRLKGDVLDFVRQNLLWLINPQKFLEQGDHAKK